MSWTNRVQPSTSWSSDRETIGNIRVTEGGDTRITESIFVRITEGFSWAAVRAAVSTSWVSRIIP